MIYFNKPIDTRGNFHSHSAKKQKGGVWVLDYISERNAIPKDMRDIPMAVFTMKSSTTGVAQLWLLQNNPSTENTSNSDWTEYRFTQNASDGFDYVGFWNPDNTTEATLQDSGAVGQNGKFYVVVGISTETTVTIPGLFASQPTAVNLGDRIESNGVRWVVRPSTAVTWSLIPDKPQSIVDYENGTVIDHNHEINDINGLATALASFLSSSDVADSGGLYDDVDGEKIINKTFLDTFFYNREQIDLILASGGGGGGDGIVTYSIVPNGTSLIANKYYGYDNKIWLCVETHTKGTSFDYTKFQYQNATDIKFHTFTVVASQAGTTTPQFTIPSASPGELHVLSAVRFNGEDQNIDELTYQLITSSVENDTIEFTVSGGSEFTIGDKVHLKYYSDEAQASGRTIAYETKEDKSWTSLATTGDNQNTGYTPTFKPLGHIDVRHDATGFSLVIGYGDKTKGAYWSNDSGTTALGKPDDIIPGTSYLYYNGTQNPLIGDLTTSSAFSSYYSYARLEGDFRIGGTVIKRTSDGMDYDDNAVPTIANILDNLILDGGDSTSS